MQAAHAAEILIKARIAQEHPLLIFERIPRPDAGGQDLLSFKKLLTEGRTYQYVDLPHRLWATTGIVLASTDNFLEFGRLRNAIQHFATPLDVDLSQRTLNFIFSVIDPFISACWGYYAIDYCEDTEPYVNFLKSIISREISFIISPGSLKILDDTYLKEVENPSYVSLIEGSYRRRQEKDRGKSFLIERGVEYMFPFPRNHTSRGLTPRGVVMPAAFPVTIDR